MRLKFGHDKQSGAAGVGALEHPYRIQNIFSLLVPPITHLRRLAAYVSTTRVSPLTRVQTGHSRPEAQRNKKRKEQASDQQSNSS